MITHIAEDSATGIRTTGAPSQGSVPRLHSAEVVRKLAALPWAFYSWMSGPPATEQERLRAALGEGTNSQAHRRIFL